MPNQFKEERGFSNQKKSAQKILVPSAYHIKLHSSKEDFEHPSTFEKTIQRYSNHEYII
jgi:hypothetical protein